jgi:2-C-methyl-D-erythritol 2,4-cyclodiphosphate synthase
MNIGHGFDIHRLEPGAHLVIGGVDIPWTHSLVGHSDADVLIHAVCDALLGAAGLGDIGRHFSNTDSSNENRNSREYLRTVRLLLAKAGFRPHNIDCTVLAEAPKLESYLDAMQVNMASDLLITPGNVHVKATTTEQLGSIGRGEGIAAFAVALIDKAQKETKT